MLQTTLESTTTIVGTFEKAHNNNIDGNGRAVYDRTEKRDKRVGVTIIKNSTNFFSSETWTILIHLQDVFIKA